MRVWCVGARPGVEGAYQQPCQQQLVHVAACSCGKRCCIALEADLIWVIYCTLTRHIVWMKKVLTRGVTEEKRDEEW